MRLCLFPFVLSRRYPPLISQTILTCTYVARITHQCAVSPTSSRSATHSTTAAPHRMAPHASHTPIPHATIWAVSVLARVMKTEDAEAEGW